MENFAIITGGARGLGKAFGFELAKKGYCTILIDLPDKGLASICNEIKKKYNLNSIYYETDLTKIENIIEITKNINEKYKVSILINNAGVGGTQRFDDVDVNYLNTIIQLNVMATTIMIKQILPNLQKQEKSYILNVSSIAAFSPVAFKTAYPASKIYVNFLARGLYEEYKKTNVFISVVHPGPMKTNSEVTARINKLGFWGEVSLLSPERVAEISVRQLFKRNVLIILTRNRLSWLLLRIVPNWIMLPLFSKIARSQLKK